MRILRFSTPILSLLFSIVAEVVLYMAGYVFGSWGRNGPSSSGIMGFITHVCVAFHFYAYHLSSGLFNGKVSGQCMASLLFFSVALFQWWLMLVISIAICRYFLKNA
jgi:hypothetical protein